MKQWNVRYVFYAQSNGNTPEEQLKVDNSIMAEFIVWIYRQWTTWCTANGRRRHGGKTDEDHKAFDKWLKEEVEKI